MSREPRTTPTLWLPRDLVAAELDVAFSIQKWRIRRTWGHQVNKLLSTHPLADISVVVPVLLAFALPFAGYTLLWSSVATFFVCLLLDKAIGAHTPRGLDPRIVSLSAVSPRGFPAFEVALAAAVFLSLNMVRAGFRVLPQLTLHSGFLADIPVPWRAGLPGGPVCGVNTHEDMVHLLLPVQPAVQRVAGWRDRGVRPRCRPGASAPPSCSVQVNKASVRVPGSAGVPVCFGVPG